MILCSQVRPSKDGEWNSIAYWTELHLSPSVTITSYSHAQETSHADVHQARPKSPAESESISVTAAALTAAAGLAAATDVAAAAEASTVAAAAVAAGERSVAAAPAEEIECLPLLSLQKLDVAVHRDLSGLESNLGMRNNNDKTGGTADVSTQALCRSSSPHRVFITGSELMPQALCLFNSRTVCRETMVSSS